MGRVKVKHPRPKEISTRRLLLDILAPTVKVTRLIPAWDSVIVLTASDRDTDAIFRDSIIEKLREKDFTAVMPPELRSKRTVICFRIDDLIAEHDPQAMKVEIERVQEWAKVDSIYKFPRSNTFKATFKSSDMAKKACEEGLRMFSLSVASSQIREEVYIPLMSCDRCHAVEDHPTNQCQQPVSYKKCSECSSSEHTFRDCNADAKKCPNCGNDHSAKAMRCPLRKQALKEKEESLKRERAAPKPTYAQSALASSSTPHPTAAFNMSALACIFHAHLVNSTRPGSFQKTLSEGLKLNGLPDIQLPPDPPSTAIIHNLMTTMSTPPTLQAASTPTSIPPATPAQTTGHGEAPEAAPRNDSESAPQDDDAPSDDDDEDVTLFIVKRHSDKWPKKRSYANLRKAIQEGRFIVSHTGDERDSATVQEFLRKRTSPLDGFCCSVPDENFAEVPSGPISSALAHTLRTMQRDRRNDQ